MNLNLEAREAEKRGDWELARFLWLDMGHKIDADACNLIIESKNKGDMYRERILEVGGVEPEKNDSLAWVRWYEKMNEVYSQIYK